MKLSHNPDNKGFPHGGNVEGACSHLLGLCLIDITRIREGFRGSVTALPHLFIFYYAPITGHVQVTLITRRIINTLPFPSFPLINHLPRKEGHRWGIYSSGGKSGHHRES